MTYPTHESPEFVIRIIRRRGEPDYLRCGPAMVTFHTLERAAQVAQTLNAYAAGPDVYRAVDANDPESHRLYRLLSPKHHL